jgi:hypothetical protein
MNPVKTPPFHRGAPHDKFQQIFEPAAFTRTQIETVRAAAS